MPRSGISIPGFCPDVKLTKPEDNKELVENLGALHVAIKPWGNLTGNLTGKSCLTSSAKSLQDFTETSETLNYLVWPMLLPILLEMDAPFLS
jgi:hypothetical protein